MGINRQKIILGKAFPAIFPHLKLSKGSSLASFTGNTRMLSIAFLPPLSITMHLINEVNAAGD